MIGYIKGINAKYGLAASVAFITFIFYLPALQHEFVEWDDSKYVIGNTHIRSFGPAFFRWAFFDFYAANWHPLTWISHALDYAVWGLNPMGHHLTNNILHTVNTFLVVLLVVRLMEGCRQAINCKISPNPCLRHLLLVFPKRGPALTPTLDKGDGGGFSDKKILITAGVTGLLFGLHPIHVESVAWVAERKDLLCALFFLLSLMKYISYRTYMTYTAYILSLFFFILALMSKPMAVTLPFVLLILDWYPFRKIQSLSSFRTAFIEKLPFIALGLISSVVTILAQKAGGAVQSLEFAPLSGRLFVASQSLVLYLWKMLLPLDLVPYYPYPRNISPLSLKYLSALALVLGITAACLALRKKHEILLSVWGYYLVTLIPVLGIVQVGGQAMADRYTYLPGLGPFLLTGVLTASVSLKMRAVKRHSPMVKLAGVLACFVVLFFLASFTLRQIAIWKNTFTLWNYVIEKDPTRVPEAYNNRGLAFSDKGQLNEAIEDYTKAIAINPFYSEALINRAVAFTGMDQLDKAIEDYTVVIVSNPFDQVYYLRGAAFEKKGQTDKAMEDYKQTIALNQSYLEAYIRLGVLYGKSGALDKAIDQFNRAVSVKPDYALSFVNRGFAYSLMGRYAEALRDLDKAIELDRSFAGTFVNRGKVYLEMGDRERAVSDFKKACALGEQEGCIEQEDVQRSMATQRQTGKRQGNLR